MKAVSDLFGKLNGLFTKPETGLSINLNRL